MPHRSLPWHWVASAGCGFLKLEYDCFLMFGIWDFSPAASCDFAELKFKLLFYPATGKVQAGDSLGISVYGPCNIPVRNR